jgi:hypothetical protein
MRLRRARAILWATAVTAGASGTAVLALAVCVSARVDVPPEQQADPGLPITPPIGSEANWSPAAILSLCDGPGARLRAPLYDPPPPPAPVIAPPPPPPPLAVTLAGTVVESDARRCRALFQGADGRTVLRRVGEQFGLNGSSGTDVVLIDVTPGAATVRCGGRTTVLHVPARSAADRAAGGN